VFAYALVSSETGDTGTVTGYYEPIIRGSRMPSALNRFQWIDNSTTPPTIWYPDFLTQMIVRIQPLE